MTNLPKHVSILNSAVILFLLKCRVWHSVLYFLRDCMDSRNEYFRLLHCNSTMFSREDNVFNQIQFIPLSHIYSFEISLLSSATWHPLENMWVLDVSCELHWCSSARRIVMLWSAAVHCCCLYPSGMKKIIYNSGYPFYVTKNRTLCFDDIRA